MVPKLKWLLKPLKVLSSPAVLTGMGVAGYLAMIPVTVHCKTKADKLWVQMEAEKEEAGEEPVFTKLDRLKIITQAYWPTGAIFILSSACVGASYFKQHGAIDTLKMSLVALQEEKAELKSTLKKELGEKEARKLLDKADQDLCEKRIREHTGEIERTGHGDVLCMDILMGRLFYADAEHIRRAFNDFNRQRLADTTEPVSWTDLYYYLDLPTGEAYSWLGYDAMQDILDYGGPGSNILPDFISGLTDDGEPYLGFRPSVEPLDLRIGGVNNDNR